ncbi:MAG: AraC family transcriptional regulator [Clostridiales bacterium]|jgi:AraC-like DNA-binding protein/uncharacterized cupin superfamily protein|nr:AraC family transcriptional regulator [Clostridiales bacterium]
MAMRDNSIINLSGKRLIAESYYNQTFSDYAMTYHMHNTYEFFYVASGKCKFSVFDPETGKHTPLPLKAGDFIFFDSDVFHKLEIKEHVCRLFNLELKALELNGKVDPGIVLDQCLGLKSALEIAAYIHLPETGAIKDTVDKIFNLLNSDQNLYADHPFTQTLINELLLDMDRSYRFLYLDNRYVRRTIEFIMANYNEDINSETIANNVKLNVSYLHKLFQKATGTTFCGFLKKYRIEHAVSLIKNTQLNFADIAYEVGFSNRQTFFNVFRDTMGVTPSQYKKYLSTPVTFFHKDYRAEVTLDSRDKI